MARLSVVSFTSLDGVVQSPLSPDEDRDDGFDRGGWVPPYADDVVDAFVHDATVGAGGLLMGRRTYEIMSAAWAGADQSDAAVAAMSRVPKHVVTSSTDELTWSGSRRLGGDLRTEVERAQRATVGGDLVVLGASRLVQALAELDLVDEYRLLVFPVVLGSGKRLFGATQRPAPFRLTSSTVSPSGVAIHTWVRERA